MFCRKCGKQISDDSDFCQFCGIKILDIDRDSSQASDVKNDSQNDLLSSDVKKESSQNQESYQNQERNRKSALSIIFDYKVYLLVVAILTSVAIILGKMNIEGNTSEVGMENLSEGSGITGELSRFIGASEETFLKETGLSKNDDGAYPSLNNMVFYFDNGEIYTITLNQNSKVNLDECSLFGLKIGDILEDVQYKLSQYEYVDTHDENVGNLNRKVDTYKITTDNSVISVSYANWDHAILSILYMRGLSEEDWGISEEPEENFGDEARSAENAKIEDSSIDYNIGAEEMETQYDEPYIIYNVKVSASDGGVNLREYIGTESAILYEMIPNGTVLPIYDLGISSSGRQWGYTLYKGIYGWIALSQTNYEEVAEIYAGLGFAGYYEGTVLVGDASGEYIEISFNMYTDIYPAASSCGQAEIYGWDGQHTIEVYLYATDVGTSINDYDVLLQGIGGGTVYFGLYYKNGSKYVDYLVLTNNGLLNCATLKMTIQYES